MHMEMQLLKRIVFLLVLLFFGLWISRADSHTVLPPRFSAAAYTGVYTVGQADLMVSLDGDSQHNLYVDPQGAYGSDQQWYGDFGLGYRWVKSDAAILGWYLYAGHTRVENNSNFWMVSPGVEALGSRWDARINAYIPVAGRSNEVGNVDFNIVSEPFFTGHTEVINSQFNVENEIQQIGNGADARVGYQFFRQVPLKGYVGTYFFGIANTNNIFGGAAGLEYWFDDNIRVFANYSYDNYQHSSVVGGLGISFGGVRKHRADPSLSERLTDPIDRYLANLGHGSGIPSKTLLYGMGRGSSSQLISSDIAFFSQTGTPNAGGAGLTLANCTFEDPCGPTDFSQTGVNTLNTLLPNTMLYFNGGTYPANDGVAVPLTLNSGQGVFSRTADYSTPATGAARSSFNGGFNLTGNNQLDGVILNNTSALSSGISGNGATNLLISNSQIGDAGNPYDTGIDVSSSSLTLENSVVNFNEVGINLNNSFLLIQSSVINTGNMATTAVVGIDATSNSSVQVINSQINAFAPAGSISSEGIVADDSSVTVNGSGITVTNTLTPDIANGLETVGTGIINMNQGTLSVSGVPGSTLTDGLNIVLNGVACTLNGMSVVC